MAPEDNLYDILEEKEDLYEHHRIVVDPGQQSVRIDKYLFNRIGVVSRSKIQHAAHAGNIVVNNRPVKPNYKIKPGDIISVLLPEPIREFEVIPENIPFEIVYEDEDILVVNKSPGMVVHPGHGNFTGTLLNGLMYYYQNQPEVVPSLIHRIDKDTSGILLVGKNELAQSILGKQFFEHSIDRKYIALVWGDVKNDQGTIEGNIGRNPSDRTQMWVFADGSQGKPARTHYRVLERFGYVTLVECTLDTGRTHQIRAHFTYLGHPLFNDEKYGGHRILKGTIFTKYRQFIHNCFEIMPRQALHAQMLGIIHPRTRKKMVFEAPLPQDFSELLEKWRHYIRWRHLDQEEL